MKSKHTKNAPGEEEINKNCFSSPPDGFWVFGVPSQKQEMDASWFVLWNGRNKSATADLFIDLLLQRRWEETLFTTCCYSKIKSTFPHLPTKVM